MKPKTRVPRQAAMASRPRSTKNINATRKASAKMQARAASNKVTRGIESHARSERNDKMRTPRKVSAAPKSQGRGFDPMGDLQRGLGVVGSALDKAIPNSRGFRWNTPNYKGR